LLADRFVKAIEQCGRHVTAAEPFEDDAVWSSIDDCPQDRGIHSDDYRDYFVLGLLEFVRSGASGSPESLLWNQQRGWRRAPCRHV
jgi:hypothetical protein